jgi:hypothetical protein
MNRRGRGEEFWSWRGPIQDSSGELFCKGCRWSSFAGSVVVPLIIQQRMDRRGERDLVLAWSDPQDEAHHH